MGLLEQVRELIICIGQAFEKACKNIVSAFYQTNTSRFIIDNWEPKSFIKPKCYPVKLDLKRPLLVNQIECRKPRIVKKVIK